MLYSPPIKGEGRGGVYSSLHRRIVHFDLIKSLKGTLKIAESPINKGKSICFNIH